MSKLDSKPKHVANIPMSSHDLSHTLDYTSSTGMILPVCYDILNPGEKVSINVDVSNTRTMPVATAAYADIDIHVDYFFVPLTLLYSPFESFIYQINSNFSSTFANEDDSYWNQLPLLDTSALAAYVNGVKDSYTGNFTNMDCIGAAHFRLMDMFGMNPYFGTMKDDTDLSSTPSHYPSVFPWQLLAYNAVYQYYYRLDDREKFEQSSFNVDYQATQGTGITYYSFFRLHYRPNYMDYFNSVKNSPIVTATNLADQPNQLPLAKQWLSRESLSTGNVLNNGGIGSIPPSDTNSAVNSSSPNNINNVYVPTNFGFSINGVNVSSGGYSTANGNDINTANIRAMFANEKLWQITGAAKKTYDAQTLAHFGFNVPNDVKHEVTHIGHDVTPIRIGEVISTATTEGQPLGTVAGKGYAANVRGSNHKFTAPCHGVLLALTSSMVRKPYISGMLKCNAVATWQDFYQPEFDHLGMQPLFDYEQSFEGSASIVGWQYRYEQWKRRFNRCTRAFAQGYFGTWTPQQQPFYGQTVNSVRIPVGNNRYFYQTPLDLNGIMVVGYSNTWTDDYYTNPYSIYDNDPLVTHAIIDYKKLSTMSAYSMPRLDA